MTKDESIGVILLSGSLFTFLFFTVTVIIGRFREIYPDYMDSISLLTLLSDTFKWQFVVILTVSIGVYSFLAFILWFAITLIKGNEKLRIDEIVEDQIEKIPSTDDALALDIDESKKADGDFNMGI